LSKEGEEGKKKERAHRFSLNFFLEAWLKKRGKEKSLKRYSARDKKEGNKERGSMYVDMRIYQLLLLSRS